MLDGSFIKRCGVNVTLLCGSREGAYPYQTPFACANREYDYRMAWAFLEQGVEKVTS